MFILLYDVKTAKNCRSLLHNPYINHRIIVLLAIGHYILGLPNQLIMIISFYFLIKRKDGVVSSMTLVPLQLGYE